MPAIGKNWVIGSSCIGKTCTASAGKLPGTYNLVSSVVPGQGTSALMDPKASASVVSA